MVDLLRRMFFTDLNNKAMALVLAILVWAYAFNNTDDTDTLRVTVDILEEFPEDQIIVARKVTKSDVARQLGQPFDGTVSLTVKAQKSKLDGFAADAPSRYEHLVSITGTVNLKDRELFKLPPGFSVDSVSPEIIEVTVEDLASKEVPLTPNVIGTPVSPYRKPNEEGVQLIPDVIEIVGPAPQVATVDQLDVTINVDGRIGPKAEVRFDLPTLLPEGVKYRSVPEQLVATAVLTQAKEEKRLENIKVLFAWPADVAVVASNVSLEAIIFQGPEEELEQLAAAHAERPFVVFVQPNLAVSGDTPVLIKLGDLKFPEGTLPAGVTLHGMDPKGPSYNWSFVEEKATE